MDNDFKRQMSYLMRKYPTVNKLLKEIMDCGDTLLLGGALREFKENGLNKLPRDFDIVVDTENIDNLLESIVLPYSPKKNRFGGYKIEFNDFIIDVWCLKDTWAFKENIIKCHPKDYSLRLQDTVFLNIDAIVYNLTKNIWYDSKYDEAIRTRVLDIVLKENPQLVLNILRTIIFKRKYEMQLSERLVKIIYEYVMNNKDYMHQLMHIQLSHFKRTMINDTEIECEIINICNSFKI